MPRPSFRPALLRAVTWAGAIALAGGVGVYLAAESVLDPDFVEERLSGHFSGPAGAVSVDIGSVRPLPHRLGLSIGALRIRAGPDGEPASTGGGGRDRRIAVVPRAMITGIGLSGLLGDGGLHLGLVRITGATLDLSALAPSSFPAGVANGADVELRDVTIGEERRPDPGRLLASVSRVSVPSYRARSPDGRSRFRLEGLEADLRRGRMHLDAVRLLTTPLAVPATALPEGTTARDTTRVLLAGLAARGLAVESGRDGPSLRARSLDVDSFRVTAVDGVVPHAGGGRGRPLTPVQRLRQFAGPAGRFDTLNFVRGRVRYTERRVGRAEVGTVVFDRIGGSVIPFPFGPAPRSEVRSPGPVRLLVRGRVARSAPVWLTIAFPDRRRGLYFDAVGSVGSLDLRELNSIFRPTRGVDIESGRLDSLRFVMRVSDGAAAGEVVPVYRGLDLSLEDSRAGGTALPEFVRNFVLGLRLNARNHPAEGDDFRTGSLRYESSPGQTFPAFFWQVLLTGLQDVAGV